MVIRCPQCRNEYDLEMDGGIVEMLFSCPNCKHRFLIRNQDETGVTEWNGDATGEETVYAAPRPASRWHISATAIFEMIFTVYFVIMLFVPWLSYSIGDKKFEIILKDFMSTPILWCFIGLATVNLALLVFRRVTWITMYLAMVLGIVFYLLNRLADESQTFSDSLWFVTPKVTWLGPFMLIPVAIPTVTIIAEGIQSILNIIDRKDTSAKVHFILAGIGLIIFIALYIYCRPFIEDSMNKNAVGILDTVTHKSFTSLQFTVMCIFALPIAALMVLSHVIGGVLVLLLGNRVVEEEETEDAPEAWRSSQLAADDTEEEEETTDRTWWYIGGGLAALALLGGLLFFLLRSGGDGKTGDADSEEAATEEPELTGFSYQIQWENHEWVLFAEKDGRKVNTGFSEYDTGSSHFRILHQANYDNQGEDEALVDMYGGGSAVEPPFIVYYDEQAHEFKSAFGIEETGHVEVKKERGQWVFVMEQGLRTDKYVYKNHELKLQSRDIAVSARRVATFKTSKLFADDEEGEKTFKADVDKDGESDLLTFYHDCSHAMDWGRAITLQSFTCGGSEARDINLTGSTITFLSSKTNGMPDILCSDAWLYKWNGVKYVWMRSEDEEPELTTYDLPFYEETIEDDEF